MSVGRWMSAALLWVSLLLSGAAAASEPSPADYHAQLAEGRRLVAESRYAEAALRLEEAARLYPEDFTLHLELGFAWLLAQRWPEAERAYRVAIELSPDALDARLGLADALAGQARWLEVRDLTRALLETTEDSRVHTRYAAACAWLGEVATARTHYGKALARDPDDDSARLGIERLGPSTRVGAAVHGLAQGPLAEGAGELMLGLVAGLDARVSDRWLWSGRYRYLSAAGTTGNRGVVQHEGWLRLALGLGRAEVAAHAALLTGKSWTGANEEASESGWMLALSTRFPALLEWSAAAAVSVYPSVTVWQGEAGGRIPLGSALSSYLGARAQWLSSEVRLAAVGELRFARPSWMLAVGGLYGDLTRPAELAVSALYALPEELGARFSLGFSRRLGGRWWFIGSYDLERYRSETSDRLQHRLALGIGLVP